MGCTSEQSNCDSDEKPTRRVTISDFYIGKYEVTQKQWRAVMGTSTDFGSAQSASLSDPSNFKGCDDCPVERVSWNDIQEFIKTLNQKTGKKYRLPTEAEWEFAARGGSAGSPTRYSGSNNIDEVAWYDKNSGSKTNPVGRKKANELGLFDMSGNVWEWCSDWYGSYSSGSQTNPQGPSSGSGRVLRGGGWFSYAQYCRVSIRSYGAPGYRGNYRGFRLALAP
jgi:formylglycine-generating enzyme